MNEYTLKKLNEWKELSSTKIDRLDFDIVPAIRVMLHHSMRYPILYNIAEAKQIIEFRDLISFYVDGDKYNIYYSLEEIRQRLKSLESIGYLTRTTKSCIANVLEPDLKIKNFGDLKKLMPFEIKDFLVIKTDEDNRKPIQDAYDRIVDNDSSLKELLYKINILYTSFMNNTYLVNSSWIMNFVELLYKNSIVFDCIEDFERYYRKNNVLISESLFIPFGFGDLG